MMNPHGGTMAEACRGFGDEPIAPAGQAWEVLHSLRRLLLNRCRRRFWYERYRIPGAQPPTGGRNGDSGGGLVHAKFWMRAVTEALGQPNTGADIHGPRRTSALVKSVKR